MFFFCFFVGFFFTLECLSTGWNSFPPWNLKKMYPNDTHTHTHIFFNSSQPDNQIEVLMTWYYFNWFPSTSKNGTWCDKSTRWHTDHLTDKEATPSLYFSTMCQVLFMPWATKPSSKWRYHTCSSSNKPQHSNRWILGILTSFKISWWTRFLGSQRED